MVPVSGPVILKWAFHLYSHCLRIFEPILYWCKWTTAIRVTFLVSELLVFTYTVIKSVQTFLNDVNWWLPMTGPCKSYRFFPFKVWELVWTWRQIFDRIYSENMIIFPFFICGNWHFYFIFFNFIYFNCFKSTLTDFTKKAEHFKQDNSNLLPPN